MKKHFLTIVFIFIAVAMQAQVYYSDGNTDEGQQSHKTDSIKNHLVANHITGIKMFKYRSDSSESKPARGYLALYYKYDDHGNLVDYKGYSKSGRIKDEWIYRFDDHGRDIERTGLTRNGRIYRQITNDFDKAGNNIETHWYNRGTYPSWHLSRKYNDKNQLVEMIYSTKNDRKLESRFTYSYYDDGSRKQSVEYNRKGKVLHTWNYDCSPVGELAGAKKDTSKVCIRYETDKNGNRIKVTEEFEKRGNIVRRVNKYDLHDRLLDVSDYNKKSRIVYRYSYDYNNDGHMKEALYYKLGSGDKIKNRYTYVYDTKGDLVQQVVYKYTKPDYILKYDYLVSKQ